MKNLDDTPPRMSRNNIIKRREYKESPSKKEISHKKIDRDFLLGKYESLYLGYSTEPAIRRLAASGGIGTELLSGLLEFMNIDSIITVGFHKSNPIIPQFLEITSPNELKAMAGSVYCYMHLSNLTQVLDKCTNKNVAVIVQPCFVNILRTWQHGKYSNVKFIISFFCGYNMSYSATKFLLSKSKIPFSQVACIKYRGGPYPGGFEVIDMNGKKIQFGKEYYESLNLIFLRNGCSKCPYYMGENADIALGDAWIKRYRNFSVIIARSNLGYQLVNLIHKKGKIKLYRLKETDLLKMHWHNLKYKKYGHTPLFRLLIKFLKIIPVKIIPLKILSKISLIRRKLQIGIKLKSLIPIEN